MKRNFYVSLAGALVLALGLAISTSAQGRTTTTAEAAGQLPPLPASDGVMFVEMRRLLTEVMPRVLADDPARAASINADIDLFKTRTGIDARAFERVAVGVRFTNPSPEVTKIDHVVAIANGTFNAGALAAAGRLASKGQYQETKHGGKTVYVFNINERIKIFGVSPRMNVTNLAMSVLDRNTLAVGEPEAVRAAIDASTGRGRISPALVALARSNPNAVVGFGANMPQSLLKKVEGLGNPELERAVMSIKQFYGSLSPSANGFDVLATMRAADADSARNLSDTVTALKSLAAFAVSQLSGERRRLAESAVQSLKIEVQGTDVNLRLSFAQTDIATMLRVF
ncbi:MAG TPA: hypothetical protein VGB73_14795 [Pyrinomonadaceae bacterium]|jgi:hypothetical protein